MATLRSLCPRKARLLVGKLFSCSALPVARSKIQYLTQLPVFRTAWTPGRERERKRYILIFTPKMYHKSIYTSFINKDPPLESTFTARISAFSGIQSFLGVRWKQSGTLGVPPVLTTCQNKLKETKSSWMWCSHLHTYSVFMSVFKVHTIYQSMSIPVIHLFWGAYSPVTVMMGLNQWEQQCSGCSCCLMSLETSQQHTHHPL